MGASDVIRRAAPAPVKRAGSTVLAAVLPARRRRAAVLAARRAERTRQERVATQVAEGGRRIVRGGPFAGLEFADEASWGGLAPYLIGCYEQEIHPAIEALVGRAPTTVVNVGCADGYYAVGLARRLPGATVLAYDIAAESQRVTGLTATANGVADRVEVRGWCDHDELRGVAGPGTALLVDCEGGELELLDPAAVPALAATTMLVEVHDFVDPTIGATLRQRFDATHDTEVHEAVARQVADHPALERVDPADRAFAIDEQRPTDPHPMQWFLLTPR